MKPEEYIQFVQEHHNRWTNAIHQWAKEILPDNFVLLGQITVKSMIIIFFYLIIDSGFRRLILPLIRRISKNNPNNKWLQLMLKRKVINSLLHVIPALIVNLLVPYLFYHHPKSFTITHRIFLVFLLLLIFQLWHRFMLVLEDLATDEDNYRSVAVSSFGQFFRIVGFLIIGFMVLSTIFNFQSAQVLSVVGAITAVILLVFRDPILGFVAGVHAASSQMVKKGDWIYLAKYNLEGYVKEISLITVKIEGFDKTLSTVPTYDLISSEVRNNETIIQNKKRLIKRSVFLNINSFKFLTESDLDTYSENKLLENYIAKKRRDFEEIRSQNLDQQQIYATKLTNVGLFRVYIYNFLISNPNVVKNDILMVRQREISTHGLPIEIFCFANTGVWEKYEQIQSDIFDFVLTSAKEFGLEVVQTGFK